MDVLIYICGPIIFSCLSFLAFYIDHIHIVAKLCVELPSQCMTTSISGFEDLVESDISTDLMDLEMIY